MDHCLDSTSEELCQLCSKLQEDGAKIAAMSLQLQEVMSSVKTRSKVVGRDLEEVNRCFDHHRGEVNRLKKKKEELKEKEEELRGFIIGAGHEAEVFKSRLDWMEEKACKCGHTPSKVGAELSSEEDARAELSYTLARASEYVAPPVENSIPIPIPAPCHPCGLSSVVPALEEITEESSGAICEDLDALLREGGVERARDLQKGSSNLVVCLPPQVESQRWRALNGINWMHPGPGQRDQWATSSRPYLSRIP